MRKISIYLVTICQENININNKMVFFFFSKGPEWPQINWFSSRSLFFSPPRTENQCIVSHFIFSKAYIILIEKREVIVVPWIWVTRDSSRGKSKKLTVRLLLSRHAAFNKYLMTLWTFFCNHLGGWFISMSITPQGWLWKLN